jgi:hypothetical protein
LWSALELELLLLFLLLLPKFMPNMFLTVSAATLLKFLDVDGDEVVAEAEGALLLVSLMVVAVATDGCCCCLLVAARLLLVSRHFASSTRACSSTSRIPLHTHTLHDDNHTSSHH